MYTNTSLKKRKDMNYAQPIQCHLRFCRLLSEIERAQWSFEPRNKFVAVEGYTCIHMTYEAHSYTN